MINNMTLGQERFKEINAPLSRRLKEKNCLIAVHRGSWGGNIIQNSIPAYDIAFQMGADMVESDVNATTDGVLYSFHDGNERNVLGVDKCIKQMSSQEVDALRPINTTNAPCSRTINRLSEILEHLSHGELLNIDRAWDIFPQLTALLDRYQSAPYQVLIKAPVQDDALRVLAEHPVKYMFMPICYSLSDVRKVLAMPEINTVGIEMIAFTKDSELFQDESIRFVHDHNLFTWVNAITLGDVTSKALYGLLDDDVSVIKGPDYGWGKLFEKKIDILQTDWPALLYAYRRKWFAARADKTL